MRLEHSEAGAELGVGVESRGDLEQFWLSSGAWKWSEELDMDVLVVSLVLDAVVCSLTGHAALGEEHRLTEFESCSSYLLEEILPCQEERLLVGMLAAHEVAQARGVGDSDLALSFAMGVCDIRFFEAEWGSSVQSV